MKSVAVVGASGAVGDVMIRLLEERKFPVGSIKFLASERSAGKSVTFAGESFPIEPLSPEAFEGVDIVLSSTPASVSKQYSPIAARAGAVVVDNSSAFRMDPDVPLVVPEVNPHDVAKHKGIIANPNCSTIQMVVALKPLHDAFRIRRVVVSTYQSVSGAGQKGLYELQMQTLAHVDRPAEPRAGQVRPPDRVQLHPPDRRLPPERLHQGRDEDGQRDPQDHGRRHDRRLPDLRAGPGARTATASRSWSRPSGRSRPRRPARPGRTPPAWSSSTTPQASQYPLPAAAADRDEVFVGRIRQDLDRPNALLFWCVSDNLRKGAATNAVQIAEELLKLDAGRAL